MLIGLLLSAVAQSEERPPADPDRAAGFADALEEAFPMTPEMIQTYRETHAANEAAILTRVEPEPLMDAMPVWLEPGASIPVVKLTPGIASVVGFYDRSGQPWPVRQYILGDGESYEVIQLGEDSNALAIAPRARVGWSNLVVALTGEATPVVIRVRISAEVTHYRASIQIMKAGPGSPSPGEDIPRIRAGDASLLAALIGYDLPDGAQKMQITGVEADVWRIGDDLFLRTRNPLLSPAWSAHLAAADGIRAYRLKPHTHLLLADGERIIRARVSP